MKLKIRILLQKNPIWMICFISIIFVTFYWNFLATDRYVSKANVILESPQIASPTLSFESLMAGSHANHSDMLLLRDYLLSVDMLNKLDAKFDLRQHFSDSQVDFLSRLIAKDVTVEELHEYYLKRISAELDSYAGVLRIKVTAFDPVMAQNIASFLLLEGEQQMNAMGQRLAEEQVSFLETQVEKLALRFDAARAALLDYQNQNGLVSPTSTVESINAVVARLDGELASLNAKRMALLSYQDPRSSEVKRIQAEINALEQQINYERGRMAQEAGGALNVLSSEYQSLELRAQFAQDSYSGALMALENTRIEAARKLKQVSVLQSPTLAEYSSEPRRLYNTIVFSVVAMLVALIAQMMVLIIKDHKD